jgi:hypothetical protein
MPGSRAAPRVSRRNFKQYDRDNGQRGIIAPTASHGVGTIVATASRAYYVRFVPSRPMQIVSIKFVVTAFSATDDAVDVGIINGTTGVRLVSSGATTGKVNTTNAVKSITVTSTALAANQAYYAGLAYGTVGGTAATLAGVTAGGTALGVTLFGTAVGTIEAGSTANATLPASATPASGPSTFPFLVLKET